MVQLVSLSQMMNTVRRMTGRYSPQQMSDSQIQAYINLFYTLHFPEQFKTLKLNKPYVFLTTPNVDTYQFVYENGLVTIAQQSQAPPLEVPGNIEITPPVYCQGYQLRYYQDKGTFYNRWPKLSVNQQINSGDGTSGPFSGTIPNFPFLRAQMDIFGNVTEAAVIISASIPNPQSANSGFAYAISDVPNTLSLNNTGNLVDSLGNTVGTVNYLTGAYIFTVSNTDIIPDDAIIYASVVPYQASRPTDVMFNNQQLVLRPVPAQIYQMEFQVSQQPTQLIASLDAPELDEWYLFLCAGAARLIYADFPDPEGMQYVEGVFKEQLLISQRRTLKQLATQRIKTIFSEVGRPYAGPFWGSEYSGGM